MLILVALSFLFGSQAFAQSSPQRPVTAQNAGLEGSRDAWTNRNLTPFKGQLLVLAGPSSVQGLSIRGGWSAIQGPSEFGFNIRRYHAARSVRFNGTETLRYTSKSVQGSMPIGLVYAPINNLEIGLALPLMFGLADQNPARAFRSNPNGGFGDMPIWATYQLMDGRFQLGLRAAFYLPTQTRFQFQAGLPMLARLGGVRIESGIFVHMTFHPDENLTEVFVPARVGFQITPEIFAGLRSGLNLGFASGDTLMTVPLYGFAGYTLSTGMGPIDFGLQFGFDQLFRTTPAIRDRVDVEIAGFSYRYPGDGTVDVSDFSLSIGANVALQF